MTDENNPRSAAEALFKPRLPETLASTAPAAQTALTPAVNHQPVSGPRILPVLQPPPQGAPERPAVSEPRKRRRSLRASHVGQIPNSEYGRIRTLVTYGMTTAQAAEVYDVPVSEIERVVAAKVWK